MRYLFVMYLVFSLALPVFSQPVQTIRGIVVNQFSNQPIPSASVIQLADTPRFHAVSDAAGAFMINAVPVGRYDFKVTCVGFEPVIVREIVLDAAKETFLFIDLKESSAVLNEVVIKPKVSKEKPLNVMATVSARMLSVEEAKRYAGGFDDPARLAASFAGVAGNTGENGIIVRGNAPQFLQWKMEGIEIPNPNHFGDLKTYGGGVFTALSSQVLANSDFLTSAFPAEYNNAISGVFDIAMRTGNSFKREHTFQAGLVGIDASSEGPFRKEGRASYLFNYRYSTLALLKPLLPDGADGLKYQDLSFKMNFPTIKAGTFSVWGIGLLDAVGAKAKTDSTEWRYYDDKENNEIRLKMGASGISHKIFFNNDTYLKTTLATTSNYTNWESKALDERNLLTPRSNITVQNSTYVLTSFLNKKFNARHTNKTGVLVRGMSYDLLLNKSEVVGASLKEIVDTQGFSSLISAFTSSSFSLSDQLVLHAGLNTQLFTLNNHYTIEPRIGLRYEVKSNQSLGLGYGLHSRIEPLNFYFNNSLTTGEKAVNKNLDFTKAHHLVLSYDWSITDLVHVKVEPYFQQLYDVPVIKDSSFSVLNLQTDWFFSEKLENTGAGRNFGIDLTLEKYISRGYYYLLTASVFKSEYKGGDDLWHNTRYNRNFVFNVLAGKEWQMGKNNQNVMSLNAKATYQGGNRYSPVDLEASQDAQSIVFDETDAFSGQVEPSLTLHFTASYKINKKHSSREIALKVINATSQPDFNGFKYNYFTQSADKDLAKVVVPNLSYKIQF